MPTEACGAGLGVRLQRAIGALPRTPTVPANPSMIPDAAFDRTSDFEQLRWALRALADAGSEQGALFADRVMTPGTAAVEFDRSASLVRERYEPELTAAQSEALAVIARKFATMSRDAGEFDAELWSADALSTSQDWSDIRELASSALQSFGWLPAGKESGADPS